MRASRSSPATEASPWLQAAGAALAAPLSAVMLGASPESAFTAGAIVALFGSGIAFAQGRADPIRRPGSGAPPVARMLAGAGLILLGAAAAVPILPGAPSALHPSLVLLGALGAAAGLGLLEEARARAQGEADALRAVLARRESDVRAQAERLRKLDQFDPVTGLLNRRAFAAAVADALAECAGAAEPLALLLFELPPSAPEFPVDPRRTPPELRRVARALGRAVRASDLLGRVEHARLAVLLPRCQDARPALARLRSALHGETRVAGVALGARGPYPDGEGLLASAEAALAAARRIPHCSDPPIWPIDWGLAIAAPEK